MGHPFLLFVVVWFMLVYGGTGQEERVWNTQVLLFLLLLYAIDLAMYLLFDSFKILSGT